MINRDKVKLNEFIYWSCTTNSTMKIAILKMDDNGKCVVQTKRKGELSKPFVRSLQYIFNEEKHAKTAIKDFQHVVRKSKRKK